MCCVLPLLVTHFSDWLGGGGGGLSQTVMSYLCWSHTSVTGYVVVVVA